MYYNKDWQQKERERDILILIGMKVTIIAYLLVHLCRRMMEKKTIEEHHLIYSRRVNDHTALSHFIPSYTSDPAHSVA